MTDTATPNPFSCVDDADRWLIFHALRAAVDSDIFPAGADDDRAAELADLADPTPL